MTTSRVNTDLLNDPFFIGFDSIFNKLNQFDKSATKYTNYPPYNLIKTGENSYLLELAVAGFDEEDLNIDLHDGVLTISANIGEYDEQPEYLHKGIAARSFVRKFTLSDTIEVESASLKQGMLTVKMRNIIPEEKRPKKIPISNSEKTLLTE